MLVTEAVDALTTRGEPATVNAVAHEIGIDQSGASRMIKTATDAGYLIRAVAASDGRRRETAVTATGRAALEHAHAWQEQVFAELTSGWSQTRRDDFTSAVVDLIAQSYALEM